MALLPQIDNPIVNESNIITLPTRTYKLIINEDKNDRIIGFTDGIEAMKQAIYHILMTERYSYEIYSDNYGIELEQYIGKGIDYLQTTIQDTLKEALTVDLRISDVTVTNISKVKNDIALIEFEVECIYGDLQMEVNVIV